MVIDNSGGMAIIISGSRENLPVKPPMADLACTPD